MGIPHFSYSTIGDGNASTPGGGYIRFNKYSGATLYQWSLDSAPTYLRVSSTAPTNIPLFNFYTDHNESVVRFVAPSTEDCTGPNTGAVQTSGGIWAAKNIRTAQGLYAASLTLTNGIALRFEGVGTITTATAAVTNIISYITATNTAYIGSVMITCSRAGGSTASFTYEFKSKNVGGGITNGSLQLVSSAIDTALAGINSGCSASGATLNITVTGLAGVSIKWGACLRLIAVPM